MAFPAIKELHHTLAQAGDARLVEVVSLVDSMVERGMADSLIAPLRARLQVLRPARRLSLNRLMFMPADPIIVPAVHWRRSSPTIPRSALGCLAAEIRVALGDVADLISAELGDATNADHKIVLRCGQMLWPVAASTLAGRAMPSDWTMRTGLSAADHAAITAPLAELLRQAASIEAIVMCRAAGPDIIGGMLRDCLTSTITHAPRGDAAQAALGMVMAVLLARLDASEQLITLAGDLAAALSNPAARLASDMAIDLLLDRAEAGPAATPDLGDAIEALDRVAALLDALEQPGPAHRPTRKNRITQMRRNLDTACRARFETELTAFMGSCATPPSTPQTDAEVASREAQALTLRCFELTSRAFGGTAHYDRMLTIAARDLAEAKPAGSAAVMDHARLLEILHGPEAGLAFLYSAASAP